MLSENIRRHGVGGAILEVDVITLDPLVQPRHAYLVYTSNMSKRRSFSNLDNSHRSLIILMQHKTDLSTENWLQQMECGQSFAPQPMIAGSQLSLYRAVTHCCLLPGLSAQWPKAVSSGQCQDDARRLLEIVPVAGKVRICE